MNDREFASSLERIAPAELGEGVTGRDTLRLHCQRYDFAARWVTGRVLDLACGVGYGAEILAANPHVDSVVGIDRDAGAIAYARAHYGQAAKFIVDDAMHYADAQRFDAIVTLETIEHLPDPASFALRIQSLLRPGGVIVASAPITPSVDANPHHFTDFTERTFLRVFNGLTEVDRLLQIQRYSPWAVLQRTDARMEDMRRNRLRYYVHHPDSLARRLIATLRYGFVNRYLTVALR